MITKENKKEPDFELLFNNNYRTTEGDDVFDLTLVTSRSFKYDFSMYLNLDVEGKSKRLITSISIESKISLFKCKFNIYTYITIDQDLIPISMGSSHMNRSFSIPSFEGNLKKEMFEQPRKATKIVDHFKECFGNTENTSFIIFKGLKSHAFNLDSPKTSKDESFHIRNSRVSEKSTTINNNKITDGSVFSIFSYT